MMIKHGVLTSRKRRRSRRSGSSIPIKVYE
jgi:hypothetical protein